MKSLTLKTLTAAKRPGVCSARPSRGEQEVVPVGVAPSIADEEENPGVDEATLVDKTGWPPHPSERRDFYHRIRAFPPEVAVWRRRMLTHITQHPTRFPVAASGLPEELQNKLDLGISRLREIARILAVLHGTPDLGNKKDPTDERKRGLSLCI